MGALLYGWPYGGLALSGLLLAWLTIESACCTSAGPTSDSGSSLDSITSKGVELAQKNVLLELGN